MGEIDERTRRLFHEQLPTVHKRVLARAVIFAKDKRILAMFGGNAKLAAEDLVQEAVVRTLMGVRTWEPDRVDLEHFLVQAVRSIADSYKDRGAKRAGSYIDELGGADAPTPGTGSKPTATPEQAVAAKESEEALADEIIEAAADDNDLLELGEALLSGACLPREIQEDLGWSAEKVSVVFKKLRRRMRRRREAEAGNGR